MARSFRVVGLLGVGSLGLAVFAGSACSSSDNKRDDLNEGGEGNGSDGDMTPTGGAPTGGAPSGGSGPGGADGSGGSGTGGEGPVGDKLFEAIVFVVNEYEAQVDDRAIEVEAIFTDPDFDATTLEPLYTNQLATLDALEPGECGPELFPIWSTDSIIPWTLPVIQDDGDDLLSLGSYLGGTYSGWLYDEEGDSTDALRDLPLDFYVHPNEAEGEPGFLVEDWGELPSPEYGFPEGAYDCYEPDGCTIDAAVESDELVIAFGTSQGTRFCRGNAAATSVTIPPNLADQDTSGQIYYVTRHDEFLGGSPVRFVVISTGESFALRVDLN